MKKIYLILFLNSTIGFIGFGQSTYNRVYTILQSNCTATCHTSSNLSGGLDLTGTEQDVYNALVNVVPTNSTAAANGLKLVDPGNPRNSFLFKKVHRGLDANLSLSAGEDPTTHDTLPVLSEVEREMIRQWILFGARDTGTWVNEQTIVDFYVGQGGQPRMQPLPVPAPTEGVQLYWGPLFMQPGEEWEYNNKFHINNAQMVDVTRMNTILNEESHHYALFKFWPGHDTLPLFNSGMRKVNNIGDEAILFYNTDVIAQFPNSLDLQYPAGTGLIWNPNTVLSISYHLINYNDSVLAVEAYTNVYFAPHNPNTIPVLTAPVYYGGDNVGDLIIPNTGVDTTFVINQYNADSTVPWNLISMQAHTHKHGRDFNVWTRKADGTKDSLIYDGSYDATYTYDQGVYVWNDPPYRQFNPPYRVDMTKGLIHEATFNNSGPDTIGFGLTTEDEMYVTFIIYFRGEYNTSTNDISATNQPLQIYPNPAQNVAYVKMDERVKLTDATLKLYDIAGREVGGMQHINNQHFQVSVDELQSGYYFYRLLNQGTVVASGDVLIQR